MEISVVQWNVNGFGYGSQAEFLASQDWDIACLQEVTRKTWPTFRGVADQAAVAFDHLPGLANAGPRYAAAVLVRGARTQIQSFEVLPDMPSPERAGVAVVSVGGVQFWVGSWAAPPGVQWGDSGKGRQVNRFAAWLRDRPGPAIVGIDRNAPKWERHELIDDVWWNKVEPLLYGVERVHDLRDVYRDYLYQRPEVAAKVRAERPEGPLAVTYVRRQIPCRYDAIYASPEFVVQEVDHRWEDAVGAGSAHALVHATLSWRNSN